jgi:hypothetical protein
MQLRTAGLTTESDDEDTRTVSSDWPAGQVTIDALDRAQETGRQQTN